nr:lysine-specific histone demethylase 1 homolog 2-like [Ipomoea batatas]
METPVSVSDGKVSRRSMRRNVNVKNYSENVMDELIEGHLGGSKKKRIRTREQLERETEKEAMIALSLGFPIDALLEEEIKAGVVTELDGKEQNDYIVVRNHILTRWRHNVRTWISKGQIRETVSNEFLRRQQKVSVIIVGAGLAGLAAARQLMSFGFKVLETLRQLYAVARTAEERQLLDWHFANLEYANAGCPLKTFQLLTGIKMILMKWAEIIIACLLTIRYGDGVEVIAGGQVFQADMILCTVPLGVLKRKSIRFEPELPDKKLAAIERLGFGLLNKVAMVFPFVFWGEDLDTFGRLNQYSHRRGEFFLFYSYHTVSGGPVLVALVAGDAAQFFESTEPSTLVHHVMSILKGIYGPKGINVPDPVQSICTRWGNDPFSFGSYSHVRVRSSGSDYDALAESVDGRLFFAGEATIRQHPATMHGAYLSGLREASRIFQAMKELQNNPRKITTKNAGASKEILTELFKNPDLAFGQFSCVFDPLTDDPKSLGLMEVTFSNSCKEFIEVENIHQQPSEQPLQLFTVLSREQAHEVHLVAGGDDCKLLYLFKNLGLKLLGADSLGALGNTIATNIANVRKGKGRYRKRGRPRKAGVTNFHLPSV